MDHYDPARFIPRRDSTLVAIVADLCHMAANLVSAILGRTDRRRCVAIFGAFRVAHATLHSIDIGPAADGSRTDP